MISIEDGAEIFLSDAINRYYAHFDDDFPLYEYLDVTSGDGWSVTIAGAKRLGDLIDKAIATNVPVEKPDDYEDRVY